MTIIAVLAYLMTQKSSSIDTVIPILGAFALGAQRLLPAMQQAYRSFSAIKGSRDSFQDVLNLLHQPLPEQIDESNLKCISFEKEIELKNVSFSFYQESTSIVSDVNLVLKKGTKIGFMGSTGSGKSTLLDIIMGMLNPTEGGLYIDGIRINQKNKRSWQMLIAHVPQNIYLSDSSVMNNIS